jgi:dTDP-4-dehydrorhamnose reductase
MANLVIGGDGLIGKELVRQMPDCIWTSRRLLSEGFCEHGALYLDMNDVCSKSIIYPYPDVVYLVAAVTKGFDCQLNQKQTHRINVDAPINIASKFKDSFIVFLSSDAAMFALDTAYGRQKALAEMGLIATCGYKRVAIVRPSRVTAERVEDVCREIIAIGNQKLYGVTEL